jgi:hypothetical protein
MTAYSENIARRIRLAADKALADRYLRRRWRAEDVQDRRGRTVHVLKVSRMPRSNGLLDD